VGQTLDAICSPRVVRLLPAEVGLKMRRLLKGRVGTSIALAVTLLGGMKDLLWKVFAA